MVCKKLIAISLFALLSLNVLAGNGTIDECTRAYNNNATVIASKLLDLSDNNLLILNWITPFATETDLSGKGHNATYQGGIDAREVIGGSWVINFDGMSFDDLLIGDHNDFTFDDAGGPNGFTVGVWLKVDDTLFEKTILSKWDETSGSELREWKLSFSEDEIFTLSLYDESADVQCFRYTDIAYTDFVLAIAVYDGTGGANAADGITLYINGKEVSSTAVNSASYAGMENLSSSILIGAVDDLAGESKFMYGDMGLVFMTKDQLTADQIWNLYVSTKGYYTVD